MLLKHYVAKYNTSLSNEYNLLIHTSADAYLNHTTLHTI